MTNDRLTRLSGLLASAGLDAVAINPGPTLTYLTGLQFHLSERPVTLLVLPTKAAVIVLPELEQGKLAAFDGSVRAFAYGENPVEWPEVFATACLDLGITRPVIGVESTRLRFLELNLLQQAMPEARFVPGDAIFSALRVQKDEEEISAMREAVRIAQAAFQNTLPFIKTGVTEREIAAELSLQLLRAGSDSEFPFSPIIASGPNSANPHAAPGDRKIAPGDLIVIDWGASYGGYISDLTRTLAIEPVQPEFYDIANLTLEANKAGRAASRPGVTAGQVDQAARAVITRADYGPFFIHRTGHGIGMETHEPPYIFGENDLILAPGMTYTIEPGIYLPGRGGVRIEDNMLITADGAETLSDLPRALLVLPQA